MEGRVSVQEAIEIMVGGGSGVEATRGKSGVICLSVGFNALRRPNWWSGALGDENSEPCDAGVVTATPPCRNQIRPVITDQCERRQRGRTEQNDAICNRHVRSRR